MEILILIALAALIVFALVRPRIGRGARAGAMAEQPLVQKEWLIAMGIVLVTSVVVLFILLGGGDTQIQSLGR